MNIIEGALAILESGEVPPGTSLDTMTPRDIRAAVVEVVVPILRAGYTIGEIEEAIQIWHGIVAAASAQSCIETPTSRPSIPPSAMRTA